MKLSKIKIRQLHIPFNLNDMHRLLISLLLFFLSYALSFSQSAKIEYDFYSDQFVVTRVPLHLHIDVVNNKAINEIIYNQLVNIQDSSDEEYQALTSYLKNSKNSYISYEKESNTRFMVESIGSNHYLVKDQLPHIKWEITNDTKTIMDIDCVKATGYFRGRKWIAWFTTTYPYNIGPLEFQGLPGIIMEVYDESKKFQLAATEIAINANSYQQAFTHFSDEVKSTKGEMTMQEYVKNFDEYIDNSAQSIATGRNSTVKIIKPERTGRALIYEWEENND